MLALGMLTSSPVVAGDRSLLLSLELNGRKTDTVVEATEHDQHLGITESDLQAIGLRVPQRLRHGPDNAVQLGDLPGVSYHVDERQQILVITATDRALLPNQLRPEETAAGPAASTGYGSVFNYDIVGTAGRGGGISGLLDNSASSSYGVLTNSMLARQGLSGGSEGHTVVRLDTVLAQADVDGLRRWRVGDVVTGGLGWTRPFRLGGVQVASDFSIRPDLITYPPPQPQRPRQRAVHRRRARERRPRAVANRFSPARSNCGKPPLSLVPGTSRSSCGTRPGRRRYASCLSIPVRSC